MEFDKKFREESHRFSAEIRQQNHQEAERKKSEFLARVGAGVKEIKKKKVSTDEQTKNLLDQGLSIFDIIETRGLTFGTILSHLEKLKKKNIKVDLSFVFRMVESRRLEKIKQVLKGGEKDKGEYPLVPARHKLGNDFSFEEIRLVRLLLD